jgi:hypothetical protein
MAAVAEFAARRPAGNGPGGGGAAEFAADELACELRLTPASAGSQIRQSTAVTTRLPKTSAALHAGLIHPVHVWIIEDETGILTPQDAARADEILAQLAPGMTHGELRYAARKLVLSLDPEAARQRKQAGRRNTEVRPFRELSGNAGLLARELPSDEALASWQHIEPRPARRLRHLITARNTQCTAPGCRRAAARCDLDHTIAWDHGGLTCECDLAPLCRHHHRAKQAEGWQLTQPQPGVLVWRTPSGRTYTTTPTQYTM